MLPLEVSFGEWSFRSCGEARRECISRLAQYRPGDYLRGPDRAFFLTLFRSKYPYFEETFYGDDLDPSLADDPSLQLVDWTRFTKPAKHAQGLRVIREDGSWRPVSWRRCIDKCSHIAWVNAAARLHVRAQRRSFLTDWIKRVGNVSSISGATPEKLVIDYPIEASFFGLVHDWLRSQNLAFSDVVLSAKSVAFEDASLVESWCAFHRKHAKMRVVTQMERSPYEA